MQSVLPLAELVAIVVAMLLQELRQLEWSVSCTHLWCLAASRTPLWCPCAAAAAAAAAAAVAAAAAASAAAAAAARAALLLRRSGSLA